MFDSSFNATLKKISLIKQPVELWWEETGQYLGETQNYLLVAADLSGPIAGEEKKRELDWREVGRLGGGMQWWEAPRSLP